jgi:hypothetical protein
MNLGFGYFRLLLALESACLRNVSFPQTCNLKMRSEEGVIEHK